MTLSDRNAPVSTVVGMYRPTGQRRYNSLSGSRSSRVRDRLISVNVNKLVDRPVRARFMYQISDFWATRYIPCRSIWSSEHRSTQFIPCDAYA